MVETNGRAVKHYIAAIIAMAALIGWIVQTCVSAQIANQDKMRDAYLQQVAASTEATNRLSERIEANTTVLRALAETIQTEHERTRALIKEETRRGGG